jgi:antitoxin component of MazEF toxin-antitoxin module
MTIIKAKPKKWGNSLGIVIPKEVIESEHIKEGRDIEVVFMKSGNVLRETFGMMKGRWKESTQKMKDDLRKELYD